MSVRRFFVSPQQVKDGFITISGSDVNHLRNVLRLKVGDELVLSDGVDFEYDAKIEELASSEAKAVISGKRKIESVVPHVTLIQAISKGAKMDTIVRQATELGASGVVPVMTSRTIVKLDEEKKKKKQARWQKIAKEASEQCQRSNIPQIFPVLPWYGLLEMISSFDLVVVFWEEAEELFSEKIFDRTKQVRRRGRCGLNSYGIVIGPEGGFNRDEIKDLQKREAHCLSLGKQILRTDTATIVALGIFLYELQKLGDNCA